MFSDLSRLHLAAASIIQPVISLFLSLEAQRVSYKAIRRKIKYVFSVPHCRMDVSKRVFQCSLHLAAASFIKLVMSLFLFLDAQKVM